MLDLLASALGMKYINNLSNHIVRLNRTTRDRILNEFAMENLFKTAKFTKGEILLCKGDVARYGYKVVKGLLRSYIVDATGKEHIIQFAPEGSMASIKT